MNQILYKLRIKLIQKWITLKKIVYEFAKREHMETFPILKMRTHFFHIKNED